MSEATQRGEIVSPGFIGAAAFSYDVSEPADIL